jgi:hypothetical protein
VNQIQDELIGKLQVVLDVCKAMLTPEDRKLAHQLAKTIAAFVANSPQFGDQHAFIACLALVLAMLEEKLIEINHTNTN